MTSDNPPINRAAAAEVAAGRKAQETGDLQTAARHYAAAVGLAAGATRAWAFYEAAVAFRKCDDSTAALAAVDVALDSFSDIDDQAYLEAQIPLTKGNVLADLGLWSRASAHMDRAWTLFESVGAVIEAEYATVGRTRRMAGSGSNVAAMDVYPELARLGHPFEIRTQALNNLALLCLDMGSVDRGIELMREDAVLAGRRATIMASSLRTQTSRSPSRRWEEELTPAIICV